MARPVNDSEGSIPELAAETLPATSWSEAEPAEVVEVTKGRHAAPAPTRTRSRLRWVWEIGAVIIIAVLAAAAIRAFLIHPVSITTDAMADTLVSGDRVLVSPLGGDPQRGDVVAVATPDGWAATSDDARDGWSARANDVLSWMGLTSPAVDSLVVLRVIAVEGQRIACCTPSGQLELDGVPLVEPYLRPGVPTDQVTFDVVVPPNRLFLLGDDRAVARDSRYHLEFDDGTVAMDGVDGRVVMIAWPFTRIGAVETETGSAG